MTVQINQTNSVNVAQLGGSEDANVRQNGNQNTLVIGGSGATTTVNGQVVANNAAGTAQPFSSSASTTSTASTSTTNVSAASDRLASVTELLERLKSNSSASDYNGSVSISNTVTGDSTASQSVASRLDNLASSLPTGSESTAGSRIRQMIAEIRQRSDAARAGSLDTAATSNTAAASTNNTVAASTATTTVTDTAQATSSNAGSAVDTQALIQQIIEMIIAILTSNSNNG